jgi:hypothetical protein
LDQIKLEKKILSRNDRVAAEIRELFRSREIAVLNMVSSPGSGRPWPVYPVR